MQWSTVFCSGLINPSLLLIKLASMMLQPRAQKKHITQGSGMSKIGVQVSAVSRFCRAWGELYKPRSIQAFYITVCHLWQTSMFNYLASSCLGLFFPHKLCRWVGDGWEGVCTTNEVALRYQALEDWVNHCFNHQTTCSFHATSPPANQAAGRWLRPQQQACKGQCHCTGSVPAPCVPADGLRPLPLGTGGNNSTSS